MLSCDSDLMKRHRGTSPNSEPHSISLDDIYRFLQNNPLTSGQLCALAQEIDRLYRLQANSISQTFPCDLWLQILPKVEPYHPPVAQKPKIKIPKEFKAHGPNTSFWLACRTVSKSWKSAISQLDLSLFHGVMKNPGNPSRMLKLFNFSRLEVHDSTWCEELGVSLLTNVKALNISYLHPTQQDQFSRLTQLTSLITSGSALHNSVLLRMTHLKSLGIANPPLLTLELLTNLTCLSLTSPKYNYSQFGIPQLTNLKTLSTNTCRFYKPGYARGRCAEDERQFYDGEWVNARYHGQGKFVDEQLQESFEGEFRFGRKVVGVYTFHDPESDNFGSYDGQFDLVGKTFHGTGTRRYRDGVYTGDWVSGKKHGQGKYEQDSGWIYEGDWIDDQIKGFGVCVYPNGDEYDGQFDDGERFGPGSYKFADDGTTIDAEWEANTCDVKNERIKDCWRNILECQPEYTKEEIQRTLRAQRDGKEGDKNQKWLVRWLSQPQ